MSVQIRRADTADLDRLVALRLRFLAEIRSVHPEAFGATFESATRAFVAAAIDHGRWWSWLAEADDGTTLVGGLSMLVQQVPPHPDHAGDLDGFVFNVWVDPERRGEGIGRGLLDACLVASAGEGVRRVALSSTADGRPLYESSGFTANPDVLERRLG